MQVYLYGASIGANVFAHVLTMVITSEVFLPIFYKLSITSTYEVSVASARSQFSCAKAALQNPKF